MKTNSMLRIAAMVMVLSANGAAILAQQSAETETAKPSVVRRLPATALAGGAHYANDTAVAGVVSARPGQGPALVFSDRAISVHGVTPGGTVVLFGVARESRIYYSEIVRRAEILVDGDGDGVVQFDLEQSVPHKAIWAIVDLSSGAYTVQPSPGYENYPISLTDDQLKRDNNGVLRKIELPAGDVHELLARPGVGAWTLEAAKGSALDENSGGDEGVLRTDVSRMVALPGTTSAPDSFNKGDIVVMIDPNWMRYAYFEVTK